jgi:hypothetical protein
VIGDGADEESVMDPVVKAFARILRPNGILLSGWNFEKNILIQCRFESVSMYFRHECVMSLPVTKTILNLPNIYNWLVKTNPRKPTPSRREFLTILLKTERRLTKRLYPQL